MGNTDYPRKKSWSTLGDAGHPQPYGRLFELKNPIEAPGILNR
jgi:hypothetical protein